jgi:membrane protease YdiL (CAAX protease family)
MTDPAQTPVPLPQAAPPAPASCESFFRRLSPVAFVILTLLSVFVLYQIVAGGILLVLVGGDITTDTVGIVRWSTVIGQLLFLLVPSLILTYLRYGKIAAPLRFRQIDMLQLVVVLAGVLALQQVLQGYMFMQEAIPLPAALERILLPIKQMMEAMLRILLTVNSTGEFLLVLVMVAVVPAVSEEILFRGLVQGDLERAIGGWKSAVVAGMVFGVYHLNPFNVVPIVVIGIAFGLIVYRSGNILLAMAAHFLNNAIAVLAVWLGVADDFLFIAPQGGAGTLAVALNTVVCAVVFLALLWYFVRITRRPVQA